MAYCFSNRYRLYYYLLDKGVIVYELVEFYNGGGCSILASFTAEDIERLELEIDAFNQQQCSDNCIRAIMEV